MKFEIAFKWEDMENKEGIPYRFPDDPTSYMKKYRIPGVYRWVVFDPNAKLEAMYVGEAENLERRLKHYLKPGKSQATNLRMKALLDEYQSQKMDVRFQRVAFDDFVINACEFSVSALSDPFVRGVIENLAILEGSRNKCTVLNKGTDVTQKKIELALKSVTSEFTASQKKALMAKLLDLKVSIPPDN